MTTPFRDDAAATREELLSLEHEHRELAGRIVGLRRDLRRHPTTQLERATKIGCGVVAAWVPVLVVLWFFGLFLNYASFRAAKNKAALGDAKQIAQAADLYSFCCDGCPPCPSIDDLIISKKLDPKKKDDPFGRAYQVVCSSDGSVWAYSAGKDGIPHTADDIASDMPDGNLETLNEL